MNRPSPPIPTGPSRSTVFGLRPVVAGTVCCVVSALGYTAAAICMRKLAALECDPMWATCQKELATVVVVGPLLLYWGVRGRQSRPPWRPLLLLVGVGLVVQLCGNLSVQWAYGIVGMAVAIPTVFGVMLSISALMGLLLLGERVPPRSVLAVALLVAAIVLLALGSPQANRAVAGADAGRSGPLWGFLGVAAAVLTGTTYAILTVAIRHTIRGRLPLTVIVFTITLMGVITLGPLSLLRLGAKALWATPPEQLAWMAAAGTANLVGFVAITRGLQLTTIVHANVLNASQVAMAGIFGMLLFNEPPSAWLILGIVLTVLGIVLCGRPKDDPIEADQHV